MPPIISVIGKSNSGKTTLVEKLIAELTSRGYRVATVKHSHHNFEIDQPGKDSWRHLQAGSEATAIISPNKITLMKPVAEELTTSDIIRLFGEDYDIILTEGFKQGKSPKIEVHRREIGPPFDTVSKLVAIATDEPLQTKTCQFSLEDAIGLTDLLEQGFIKPQRKRFTLYINNAPVTLSAFPKKIIGNVLLAMVSSLKGIAQIRSLDISIRRQTSKTD
ncbi:MAG: molybdopterin-guanine dinucleotide biosynthesis protein B [Dehalococcoidales bacterium]|jgi:molybdopterin-guanine dinucleotide biosynthesis protein MobB|nr:molybdopterin-guanine dinucleotide biosynthesis protein B [Dehalococcoidales bacterium]